MKWTRDEIIKATGAKLLSSAGEQFDGISTDSRQNLNQTLFVALKGDAFDAHEFLEQALEQGAAGILIHDQKKLNPDLLKRATVFLVDDTLTALGDLAHFYRKKCKFKVIGITGSNGKTTTKEFAREILGSSFKVHASRGSFNNHWGVPLTLLSAPEDSEIVIQEMGMNHVGELKNLARIAEPDVVLVTMVGRAHIGELGSQKIVAQAKEEIYLACPNAQAIYNLDNEWTLDMFSRKGSRPRVITFSCFNDKADVMLRATHIHLDSLKVVGRIKDFAVEADIMVSGRQHLTNIMAAIAIGLACEMKPDAIAKQLFGLKTIWGRGQILNHTSGAKVLFDGYNSNPDSCSALLRSLLEIEVSGQKIAILGEMLELGEFASAAHHDLGELAAGVGFSQIWFIGPHAADFEKGLIAAKSKSELFSSPQFEDSIASQIAKNLKPNDIVVIKGSRGVKMEKVLESWKISAPKP